MSSKRRFVGNDAGTNIDPFNAPDPIMPGGEPDFLQQEARDIDGIERVILRNERKEPGHGAHRARMPWKRQQAETPRAKRNASPVHTDTPARTASSANDAGTRRPARPRRSKQTEPTAKTSKNKRGCGCIVLLLIFIITGQLSSIIASCSSSLEAGFEDSWSQDDDSWSSSSNGFVNDEDYYDDDVAYELEEDFETLCQDETRTTLDAMAAGDASYTDLVVSGFTQSFETYLGISPADAGIDTAAIAQQALASIDDDIESAYAYAYASEDGYDLECTVYFDFSMIDIRDLVYDLSSFVDTNDQLSQAIYDEALTEQDKQLLRDELARLMEDPEEYDTFTCIDFTGSAELDGTGLVMTDGLDAWIDEFSAVVGNSSY